MFKGRRLRTALTLTALTATTIACDSGEAGDLTGPAPTQARNVAGAWHGRAEDTYGNQQDVQVFLDHGGSQVTGTIQSQMFRTNELFPLSGTMSSDETLRATVLAASRGGCFDISLELKLSTGGRNLSGTYVIDRKADGCGRESNRVRAFMMQRR